jgi:hypothetical protein
MAISMIICNRCASAGKVEPGERYVFNVSPLNAGRVPAYNVHSVDACSSCAGDFRGAFEVLMGDFGHKGERPSKTKEGEDK